ncbi:MAG: hypothetical protein QOK02_1546 [Mycobacterium sp.]|jgi:hypothetical protein|nr:hypothetical protein [Mycobacterium sp.]
MPKVGEAVLPRADVAEQLNDEGVINLEFPTERHRGRGRHEQVLG